MKIKDIRGNSDSPKNANFPRNYSKKIFLSRQGTRLNFQYAELAVIMVKNPALFTLLYNLPDTLKHSMTKVYNPHRKKIKKRMKKC